jgi:hypothetical protein
MKTYCSIKTTNQLSTTIKETVFNMLADAIQAATDDDRLPVNVW